MINLTECKVTEIFCIIDDFCKEFSKIEQKSAISDGKRHRNKPNKMSDAEVILILVLFHMGGYKCLKHYYIHHICKHCQHLFPKRFLIIVLLSCNVMWFYSLVCLSRLVYLQNVQAFLLWIQRLYEYVRINASILIRLSWDLLRVVNVPWDGSMDLNYT